MGLIFFRLTIISLVGLTLLAVWAAEQTREIPGESVVGVELLNLAEVTSLEKRFVATEQWLVGFDLGLRADAAAAALPLQVRVRSADGLPIDLVSERVPMGATDAGQLRVRFAPLNTHLLPHTITSTLLLQIRHHSPLRWMLVLSSDRAVSTRRRPSSTVSLSPVCLSPSPLSTSRHSSTRSGQFRRWRHSAQAGQVGRRSIHCWLGGS